MNTNNLKRFAKEARQKLRQQVSTKLEQVLNTDSVAFREQAKAIAQLQQQIVAHGKAALIEKVAYTWFNRLIAFRFMDMKAYTTSRIVSPAAGDSLPEILQEAKQGTIDDALTIDRERLYGLLDGTIPATNAQNEIYQMLLVAECNRWHRVMPFIFQRIDDYNELLMPQDVLSDYSIVADVRQGITEKDCENEEVIGWLYQFYIAEKKDEVFASKSKVKKEDIPAATQLFTPRWIVEYMVQNTLGKLWLQHKPQSNLRAFMPYYIESASKTPTEDKPILDSPEDLRLLDQACGSGHILVYAFDLLTKIYEEEGYNTSDIPKLIIEKNLHGFEIDERAAQLANTTLLLKARSYYRRLFRKGKAPSPNVMCYTDFKLEKEDSKAALTALNITASPSLLQDLTNMQQATNLGSLILPKTSQTDLQQTLQVLKSNTMSDDIFLKQQVIELTQALEQLCRLAQKFHCVVDNPPYMGGGNMNKELATFVKKEYPDSKADLMACFMESGLAMLKPNGYLGMINLPSWLFLSSFAKLRVKLVKNIHINSLLHMGRGIFGVDWGSTAFIFSKKQSKSKGHYFRLHKRNFQHIYPEDIKGIFLKAKNNSNVKINFDIYRDGEQLKTVDELVDENGLQIAYKADQQDFKKIPGSPIGYWLSQAFLGIIYSSKEIGKTLKIVAGISTGYNIAYIFNWFEVPNSNIWDGKKNDKDKFKFKYHNKGGEVRKWYGNQENIIKYSPNSIKELEELIGFRHDGKKFYFQESISWGKVTSSINTFRYYPKGFCFDSAGLSIFGSEEELKYLLGFLNTHICRILLNLFNPTLNASPGIIKKLPYPKKVPNIIKIVDDLIITSKNEWNSKETSWDFQKNELLHHQSNTLQSSYQNYCNYWRAQFFQLHRNEEELNRQFIDIYGLQDELSPDVPLEDITILKRETSIVDGELVFDAAEVMRQFASYAVGCMMGRYGLEEEGLLSIEKEEEKKQVFAMDDDGIIPVLEGDYFRDDIVARFREFIKVTFGKADFETNLRFVEQALGKDLRKYFVKDFYKDHLQRYKKRPIYWLFSSPKKHFQALVYLHRYRTDTASKMLNDYVREYIRKLEAEHQNLVTVTLQVENVSTREKALAQKTINQLDKMLDDVRNYERQTLLPLAQRKLELDLDDGVLVNYNKMGAAVLRVTSLNDAKARKKVQAFDWVDNRSGLE